MSTTLMTVAEAAEHYKVSPGTIRRWVRDGWLDAEQPAGPGGVVRIPVGQSGPHGTGMSSSTPAPRPITGEMSKLVRELEAQEG